MRLASALLKAVSTNRVLISTNNSIYIVMLEKDIEHTSFWETRDVESNPFIGLKEDSVDLTETDIQLFKNVYGHGIGVDYDKVIDLNKIVG